MSTQPSTSGEQAKELATRMATYAKQLAEGMRRRVKREPDVADYLPGFERLLARKIAEVRLATLKDLLERSAKPEMWKGAEIRCWLRDEIMELEINLSERRKL